MTQTYLNRRAEQRRADDEFSDEDGGDEGLGGCVTDIENDGELRRTLDDTV